MRLQNSTFTSFKGYRKKSASKCRVAEVRSHIPVLEPGEGAGKKNIRAGVRASKDRVEAHF